MTGGAVIGGAAGIVAGTTLPTVTDVGIVPPDRDTRSMNRVGSESSSARMSLSVTVVSDP